MFVKIIDESTKKFTRFKKTFNLIDFVAITSRNNDELNNNQSQLNTLKTNKQNYVTLLTAKQAKKKRLQIKREYIIVIIKNKQLRISLRKKKIALFVRRNRVRKTFENNLKNIDFLFELLFENEISCFKK